LATSNNERDSALVANAADAKQVGHARRKERDEAARKRGDVLHLMSDPVNRRVVWDWLEFCGIFESPFHPSNSFQSLNIGRGDVGRMIVSEIAKADQELYFKMQREAAQATRSNAVESRAMRTQSLTQQENDDEPDA